MSEFRDKQDPAAPADKVEDQQRQSFLELTRSIASLPLDQAAAALETSAAIAAVSLRAAIEFLRAAPAVAAILQPANVKAWGELGRRLAMSDFEAAANFFAEGVEHLRSLPPQVQTALFTLCTRQMTLSTAIGRTTLQRVPQLAQEIDNAALLSSILEVATEIAKRSAKHSAEFLEKSPEVVRAL